MTATQNAIKVGEYEVDGVKTEVVAAEHTDTFSLTVPPADKVKPEFIEMAGKKISDISFTFGQVSSEAEALEVCKAKEWDLVTFVNDALKANAKAAAYQSKLNEYKLAEFNADKAKEDMVKNLMRLQKIDEATARSLVNSLLG
jgi:hypothetical protein